MGVKVHAQNKPYDRLLATHPPANNTGKQYGGNTGRKCPATYDFRCATPIQYFGKGLSILVVEDNADMRGYIRSILRDKYNVFEAAHGAEALNILNSHSVDFIISDLMMPVMDGIELSRRVKENFAISISLSLC